MLLTSGWVISTWLVGLEDKNRESPGSRKVPDAGKREYETRFIGLELGSLSESPSGRSSWGPRSGVSEWQGPAPGMWITAASRTPPSRAS